MQPSHLHIILPWDSTPNEIRELLNLQRNPSRHRAHAKGLVLEKVAQVEERIAALVNDGRIPGISGIRNESDLKEPVRLVIELKRDADPEVVLNQLYQYSPLQDSFSIIC